MTWSADLMCQKPVEVFEPDGGVKPRGVVVFLHGYDGVTLSGNPVYTALLNERALACVCPLGGVCCWTDRIYEPFDAIRSPVEFLVAELPGYCETRWGLGSPQPGPGPAKIAVCGVELGGQGALQVAYRKARVFSTVAAISPKVDFETWYGHGMALDEIFPDREAARQATPTLHIHPLDWPKHQLLLCDPQDLYCIDGVITLASKLSSTGIPFDSDFETSHGGFGWTYANAMADRVISYAADHMA